MSFFSPKSFNAKLTEVGNGTGQPIPRSRSISLRLKCGSSGPLLSVTSSDRPLLFFLYQIVTPAGHISFGGDYIHGRGTQVNVAATALTVRPTAKVPWPSNELYVVRTQQTRHPASNVLARHICAYG